MERAHVAIQQLVDRIDRDELRLPGIQRGYVWKPTRVASLIDSLYRRYRSGSMLWRPSEDVLDRHKSIQKLGNAPVALAQYLLDVAEIRTPQTIFWDGPIGAYEYKPFAAGSLAIAQAMAQSEATTVVGGGDSGAALPEFGLAHSVTRLSTSGGATLKLIEGSELPGFEAPCGAPTQEKHVGQ